MGADGSVVEWQLGRPPRGRWRVAARCSYGHPTVIATAPADGAPPFPTLYYLTCPHLVAAVGAAESAGGAALWRERLRDDAALAARMRTADAAYREARAGEAAGHDATPDLGIAGQRDPLATKCLHAHVAARIAGIDDPVGEGVLEGLAPECRDDRCGEAA